MMREILYRGTDIAGNWHYGVPLVFTEDCVFITAPHAYDKTVIPETVGQYTGLTDKNGTKIFEGDIVKLEGGVFLIKYGKHDLECCGCCYSSHDALGFYVADNKGKAYSDDTVWTRLEVIGNMHAITPNL